MALKKPRKIVLLFAWGILLSNLYAQPAENNLWKAYNFLIGTWEGEGNGQPGQGSGTITFEYSLDKNVIIRKNHNEYPATSDRPAFVHDDLLVYYIENNSSHAIYFDNEGHVIHYLNNFSTYPTSLVMVSDINPGAPRYRFTYTKLEPSKMKVTFEFAPPGKPEEFKIYVEGIVRKKI
jgi:hypothetical protein